MFSPYGRIEEAKLPKEKDSQGKKSLRYGFVKFFSSQDALKAKEKLDRTAIGGKFLHIDFAIKKEVLVSIGKVFVSNIPLTYSQEKLQSLFSTVII
jgi:RNA recognition motif-containing protein